MGDLVDLVRRVVREENVEHEKRLRLVFRQEAERLVRRPMVDFAWLVYLSGKSERTVARLLQKWGIPRRRPNGDLWTEGDGPHVYSILEWERAERLHTRSVKNHIKRFEAD